MSPLFQKDKLYVGSNAVTAAYLGSQSLIPSDPTYMLTTGLNANVFKVWSTLNASDFSVGDFCTYKSNIYELKEELDEPFEPSDSKSGWVKVN